MYDQEIERKHYQVADLQGKRWGDCPALVLMRNNQITNVIVFLGIDDRKLPLIRFVDDDQYDELYLAYVVVIRGVHVFKYGLPLEAFLSDETREEVRLLPQELMESVASWIQGNGIEVFIRG